MKKQKAARQGDKAGALGRVLGALTASGLSLAGIEREARLPGGWTSRALAGEKAGDGAKRTREKLRAFAVSRLGLDVVEGLEAEPSAKPAATEAEERTPDTIRDALRATDAPGLERALVALREELAAGTISVQLHAQFLASVKAQLASVARRVEEKPDPIAAALEILDAEEAAAVDRVRAARLVPALAPGQAVAPPEEEQAAP